MFCVWLVEAGFVEKVTLLFLVKGHTKNDCDMKFNSLKGGTAGEDIWTADELDDAYTKANGEYITLKRIVEDDDFWLGFGAGLKDLYKDPPTGTILSNHEFTIERGENGRGSTTLVRREYRDAEAKECSMVPTARMKKATAGMDAEEREMAVSELIDNLDVLPVPGLSAAKANECETKLWKLAPDHAKPYYENRVTDETRAETERKKKAKSDANKQKKKQKKDAREAANATRGRGNGGVEEVRIGFDEDDDEDSIALEALALLGGSLV